jgi:hypothetical protein
LIVGVVVLTGLRNRIGRSSLFIAMLMKIDRILRAAITSRFHTVLQLVHLSTVWILLPFCEPADVRSLACFKVLRWQCAQTCEVRYSSIMTTDTLQLRNLRKDLRCRRSCLLGAGILLRIFPNLAFPKAMT